MNYILFYLAVLVIGPVQANLEDYKVTYIKEDPIQVVEEEIIKEDKIKESAKENEMVEEYIEEYSKKYEVDVDLAKNIAWCESNYYPNAKSASSSAEGVYQFIDGTWKHTMAMMGLATTTERKMEIPLSVEAGIFLLSEEGSGHWNASKHCWSVM